MGTHLQSLKSNLQNLQNFYSKWPNEPRRSESSVNTEPGMELPSESSSSVWKSPNTSDTPTHTPVRTPSSDTPSASGFARNPESRSPEVLTFQRPSPPKPLNTV